MNTALDSLGAVLDPTTRRSPRIDRIAVVVPARDEADRLDACLSGLQAAVDTALRRRPTASIVVVLVLDSCTDASAVVAARHPRVAVEHVEAANVGAARAAGVSTALGMLEAVSDAPGIDATWIDATWIATTDADSVVPATWLLDQLVLAETGADVVLGSVVPVRSELTAMQRLEWDRRHPDGAAIGNVHGANLGVRAAAYRDAGGFEALGVHEDVGLVTALRRSGAIVVASASTPVTTSGRSEGRAPGGYAEYLRSLAPRAG